MDLVLYGAPLSPFVRKAEVVLREKGLEGELEGRSFLVGDSFSIADLSVATQLINLELAIGTPHNDRWPNLAGLRERTKERSSVAANLAICRKILKQPVDLGL
jgi:glutathione S-transferase